MTAYGLQDYFSMLFNRFDFLVVIASILEIILTHFDLLDPMGLSVLRCARLLRIFKLTKQVGTKTLPSATPIGWIRYRTTYTGDHNFQD